MSVLRRTATGAVAALAVVISGPALTASAATNHHYHFKTLASINGGTIKGCKLRTADAGVWKVKLRVDATRAKSKVSGAAQVTKDGNPAGTLWRSRWVHRGHRSSIATMTLPKGAEYALMAGIGTGAMGNGDDFKASDLRTCH